MVIGAAIAAVEIRSDFIRTTNNVAATAEQLVELTLGAATEAVFELNPTLADNLLSGLMKNELFLSVEIVDELGQRLASQSRKRQEFDGLSGLVSIKPIEFNHDLRFGEGEGSAGSLNVVLDIQAGLKTFYSQSVLTALAQLFEAVGLSILIFILVAFTITNPVSRLAEQISNIEPGSDERLMLTKSHGQDEIGRLISSANKYLDATTKVQKDLASSREQLQNILNNLREGIILADDTGRVIQFNSSAAFLFPVSDLSDQKTTLVALLSNKKFGDYKTLLSVLEKKDIVEIEVQGKNSGFISIELSSTTIDYEGSPHTLWTFRDVSEKKKADEERLELEEQLRHSQKMEAIGTLAGGMAHDFNNILGGVTGYTEMTIREVPKNENAQLYLNNILKGTDKATQLINRILAFSYKQEENRAPVDLAYVLDECVHLVEQAIPATISIKVEKKVHKLFVMADETMMHQVMMNLFTNASSAIGNDAGEIYCTLDRGSWHNENKTGRENSAQENPAGVNDFIRLSIEDTGPGIPNENIHRIFEPYFTTKELGAGTGLGLALTHTLVEKHGGFIRVDSSQRTSGARFEVYIPALSGEFEQVSFDEPEVVPAPSGSECILIVEDNEVIADMLSQYLSSLGYTTVSRGNGKEAFETYQNSKDTFDLIITDQTMPGMNGDTMIKRIMAIDPQQPIILCTGYSDSINEEQALEMGVKHFLMKPVSIVSLGKLINEVLNEAV